MDKFKGFKQLNKEAMQTVLDKNWQPKDYKVYDDDTFEYANDVHKIQEPAKKWAKLQMGF